MPVSASAVKDVSQSVLAAMDARILATAMTVTVKSTPAGTVAGKPVLVRKSALQIGTIGGRNDLTTYLFNKQEQSQKQADGAQGVSKAGGEV